MYSRLKSFRPCSAVSGETRSALHNQVPIRAVASRCIQVGSATQGSPRTSSTSRTTFMQQLRGAGVPMSPRGLPITPPQRRPRVYATPAAPAVIPADATTLLITTILSIVITLPGLAMFHGGLSRASSVRSTLMSHFLAVAAVSTLWIALGYSIAFSTQGMAAGVINYSSIVGGMDKTLLTNVTSSTIVKGLPEMLIVLYNMKLSVVSACILLGGLVERTRLMPRIAVVALWSLLVYCPISHTLTAGPGALLGDLGVFDSASGLATHLAPAVSAVVAMAASKDMGKPEGVHNAPMAAIGTAFLWLGWLAHSAAAAVVMAAPPAAAVLNTHVAASVSMLTWSSLDAAARTPSLVGACMGVVSGLIAISPACCHLNAFGAMATGFLGAFVSWNLKGSTKGEAVSFPRIVMLAALVGCLSAGLLTHPTFGGAQTKAVFATQGVVQAFCAVAVSLYAWLGTVVVLHLTRMLCGGLLMDKNEPGTDIELVG